MLFQMKHELQSAAKFLCNFMPAKTLSKLYYPCLLSVFEQKYKNHWFPDKPSKSSAHRCIRISDYAIDPLIIQAGRICRIPEEILRTHLPKELILWIDPGSVIYRLGEHGQLCVLYDVKWATCCCCCRNNK